MVVGMTQMRKRAVIVRQLSALEALGGVTNICSDKTGTLTQGQMTLRKAWIPHIGTYTVESSEEPFNPLKGSVDLLRKDEVSESQNKKETSSYASAEKVIPNTDKHKDPDPGFEGFLDCTSLCNLASIRHDKDKSTWHAVGDRTEIALQVFAMRFQHGGEEMKRAGWRQVTELPFDSTLKRMSVVYDSGKTRERKILTKGAVERIFELCTTIGKGKETLPLTNTLRDDVLAQMTTLASQGLRVLALAERNLHSSTPFDHSMARTSVEQDLTLLGLAGPLRPPSHVFPFSCPSLRYRWYWGSYADR